LRKPAPAAVELGAGNYDDWRTRIAQEAPTTPREAAPFWKNEIERLEGELYNNRNNGQVIRMQEEANRMYRLSRSQALDAYADTMKWGPGKMPRPKPYEGMSGMIQKARGIGG